MEITAGRYWSTSSAMVSSVISEKLPLCWGRRLQDAENRCMTLWWTQVTLGDTAACPGPGRQHGILKHGVTGNKNSTVWSWVKAWQSMQNEQQDSKKNKAFESFENRVVFRQCMQREKKIIFQVNVLGRIKAGDETGLCVCTSVGSSGIWHRCLKKLLRLFGDGMQHFIALAQLFYCTSDS